MNPHMEPVVVVGSLNADLVVRVEAMPKPGETVHGSELAVLPGGKGSNQAAAASLLGAAVTIVGAVGDDAHGALLLDHARRAGVDTRAVRRLAGTATGTAVISVDAAGENSIIISAGANGHLGPQDALDATEALTQAGVLCLCLEIPMPTVIQAARLAHDAGATVLLNLSPFEEADPELLELTDVLLVNDHEAAQLLGQDLTSVAWGAVIEALALRGVARCVVTRGAQGAVVLDSTAPAGHQVVAIPAVRVEPVDTTGCGDAFTGAMSQQLAAGAPLVDAARFAAEVAAFAATRLGAQSSYPTLADLAATRNLDQV